MNTENISLLAQDFFDAHKDDLVNDGDLAIPNLYQKCFAYLLYGKDADLPNETKTLLKVLDRTIKYQLKTRIECVDINPRNNG